MHDIGAVGSNRLAEPRRGRTVPHRRAQQAQAAHGGDVVVVHLETHGLMPERLEQLKLRPEHLVFATRLLVIVVRDEHLHRRR